MRHHQRPFGCSVAGVSWKGGISMTGNKGIYSSEVRSRPGSWNAGHGMSGSFRTA